MIRAFETEDRYILDTTSYAIAAARRFDQVGVLMSVLEVDVTLPAADTAMALQLNVSGVVPAEVDAEDLVAEARQALAEDPGTRAWGFVEPHAVAIDVLLDHATIGSGTHGAVAPGVVSPGGGVELVHAESDSPLEGVDDGAPSGETNARHGAADGATTSAGGAADGSGAVQAGWAESSDALPASGDVQAPSGEVAAAEPAAVPARTPSHVARAWQGAGRLAAEVGAAIAGLRVLAQPPRLDGRRGVVLGALLAVVVLAVVLMQLPRELPGLVANETSAEGAAGVAAARVEPTEPARAEAVVAAPTAPPVGVSASAAATSNVAVGGVVVVGTSVTASAAADGAAAIREATPVAESAKPETMATSTAATGVGPATTAVTSPTADTSATGSRGGAAAGASPVAASAQQSALLDFTPQRQAGLPWPNDQQSVGWFAPDGYHLAARKPGQFVAIGVLQNPDLRNALVAATFHKIGGPAGGGYGIILRDQPQGPRDGLNQLGNYLVFEVGDKGEVGIWRRDQDQWVDILGWTASPAVKPGSGENALSVRAVGDQLEFSVNGTPLPTQISAQPTSGGVGVFLGGDANEAVLTQLTVTPAN
jgi:hypothetical protein